MLFPQGHAWAWHTAAGFYFWLGCWAKRNSGGDITHTMPVSWDLCVISLTMNSIILSPHLPPPIYSGGVFMVTCFSGLLPPPPTLLYLLLLFPTYYTAWCGHSILLSVDPATTAASLYPLFLGLFMVQGLRWTPPHLTCHPFLCSSGLFELLCGSTHISLTPPFPHPLPFSHSLLPVPYTTLPTTYRLFSLFWLVCWFGMGLEPTCSLGITYFFHATLHCSVWPWHALPAVVHKQHTASVVLRGMYYYFTHHHFTTTHTWCPLLFTLPAAFCLLPSLHGCMPVLPT